jgi:hypothetical protein
VTLLGMGSTTLLLDATNPLGVPVAVLLGAVGTVILVLLNVRR